MLEVFNEKKREYLNWKGNISVSENKLCFLWGKKNRGRLPKIVININWNQSKSVFALSAFEGNLTLRKYFMFKWHYLIFSAFW